MAKALGVWWSAWEVMMAAVLVAGSRRKVDSPLVVRERLEEFAGGVLGEAMNRPVQVANGGVYLRVGAKGTVPLGWALYLPEEWCECA